MQQHHVEPSRPELVAGAVDARVDSGPDGLRRSARGEVLQRGELRDDGDARLQASRQGVAEAPFAVAVRARRVDGGDAGRHRAPDELAGVLRIGLTVDVRDAVAQAQLGGSEDQLGALALRRRPTWDGSPGVRVMGSEQRAELVPGRGHRVVNELEQPTQLDVVVEGVDGAARAGACGEPCRPELPDAERSADVRRHVLPVGWFACIALGVAQCLRGEDLGAHSVREVGGRPLDRQVLRPRQPCLLQHRIEQIPVRYGVVSGQPDHACLVREIRAGGRHAAKGVAQRPAGDLHAGSLQRSRQLVVARVGRGGDDDAKPGARGATSREHHQRHAADRQQSLSRQPLGRRPRLQHHSHGRGSCR